MNSALTLDEDAKESLRGPETLRLQSLMFLSIHHRVIPFTQLTDKILPFHSQLAMILFQFDFFRILNQNRLVRVGLFC